MIDSKKRLFKKQYAQELFRIAQGDLQSARILAKDLKSGRPENVVFLAQQSVEKSVKAVLVHAQIAFPLVHDLGILVALVPDDHAPPSGFNLTELNPYASVKRYEEGQLPLTIEEIEIALDVSQKVLLWAQNFLKN